MLNLKSITLQAKHLHRMLVVGVASISLLGVLSGCHQTINNASPSNITFTKTLVNHRMSSISLNKMLSHQYKWPVSDLGSALDVCASDTILHNGYVEQASDRNHTKHFSDYGKNYDELQPSDGKSRSDKQTVHYHINNKKETITFNSIHADNSLHTITYKLFNKRTSSLSPNKTVYEFKPIRLRRYGHKHNTKVPNAIAKHNILKLKPGIRIHKAHRYSLNNVQ